MEDYTATDFCNDSVGIEDIGDALRLTFRTADTVSVHLTEDDAHRLIHFLIDWTESLDD